MASDAGRRGAFTLIELRAVRRRKRAAFTLIELPAVRRRKRAAFTLIELLVVVAILALLLTLLLPSLQKARAIALRVICGANCRNIGLAGNGFASEHQGRGPGGGGYGPRDLGPWIIYSSLAWCDVLNTEFYKGDRIERIGFVPQKGKLYCPCITYWGSPWPRGHYWNRDAAGGPNWGGAPHAGVYGLEVDPRLLESLYPHNGNGDLNGYALGAKFELFRSPGTTYLLLETEAGDDSFGPMTQALGPVSGYPPWVFGPGGNGYGIAYRHVLPRDKTLYKSEATSNLLFMDCHVEVHNPVNTITTADRFLISP